MRLLIILLFILFPFVGLADFPYALDKPWKRFVLPEMLAEVSGLTDLDSANVACVQDEHGIVFTYNFVEGKLTGKYPFESVGDFEGLTYTGSALYILRSDGRLTEWDSFPINKRKPKHYQLALSTSNNEGLCYDTDSNRLLIAAKSKPIDHDKKSLRLIYEFNLTSKKLNPVPVYSLSVDVLASKAAQFGIVRKDTTAKGTLKPFNFHPASLAVHPLNNLIYIISAADFMIVVIDRNGTVVNMIDLNPATFTKAEGITFLKDGTMIITNEAAGKEPTLLVYKMN